MTFFLYTEYPEKSRGKFREGSKCYKSTSATGAGEHEGPGWAHRGTEAVVGIVLTYVMNIFLLHLITHRIAKPGNYKHTPLVYYFVSLAGYFTLIVEMKDEIILAMITF